MDHDICSGGMHRAQLFFPQWYSYSCQLTPPWLSPLVSQDEASSSSKILSKGCLLTVCCKKPPLSQLCPGKYSLLHPLGTMRQIFKDRSLPLVDTRQLVLYCPLEGLGRQTPCGPSCLERCYPSPPGPFSLEQVLGTKSGLHWKEWRWQTWHHFYRYHVYKHS